MAYHVSKAKFAELVEQALAELPEQFAEYLDEVPVEIRDRSTAAMPRRPASRGTGCCWASTVAGR